MYKYGVWGDRTVVKRPRSGVPKLSGRWARHQKRSSYEPSLARFNSCAGGFDSGRAARSRTDHKGNDPWKDRAAHARRQAGPAGNMVGQYADAFRTAEGTRHERVLHRRGTRRSDEEGPDGECGRGRRAWGGASAGRALRSGTLRL